MMNDINAYYQVQKTEIILVLIGVVLLITVNWFELDFTIADAIYNRFGWTFKKSFFVDGLLHVFARIILIAGYLGLLYLLLQKLLDATDPKAAYNLFILLIAIGSSVAIVSIAKRFLDVDCPWDLIRYGGDKPYFPLFEYDSQYLPSAHCFPASHASVGFSWIALFFYFNVVGSHLKFKALALVLCVGLIFGFAQQLRGAHFISHDLWSYLICLINCIFIYKLAYKVNPSKILGAKNSIELL